MSDTINDKLYGNELVILRLIARGLSNKQIADELAFSLDTVKWYNKRIFTKLEVKRRTQAVRVAQSRGILDVPDIQIQLQLPIPPTKFIGRRTELKQLLNLLQSPDSSLVSIVGPGGIGKTRLALQLATVFKDTDMTKRDISFVGLDTINQYDDIILAIAHVAGIQFVGNRDLSEQLLSALSRRKMLLILDNCEHLLSEITIVAEMLATSPHLQVLATSRERLNLRGEKIYQLSGLDHHENSVNLDSIQLFLQTARLLHHDFVPTEEEDADIGHICDIVEAVPLAIELSAAWVDIMSIREIRDKLQGDPSILRTVARDIPERHRSIETVFEHSWNLMDEQEQLVFKKLSVFRGGFDQSAAEHIVDASPDILKRLLSKSCITMTNPSRWKLHELLRYYCELKLNSKPNDVLKVRSSHCEYYTDLMSNEYETQIVSNSYSIIESEIDNIWYAWDFALQQSNFTINERLLHSLSYVYFARGLQPFLLVKISELANHVRKSIVQSKSEKSELLLAKVLQYLLPLQIYVDSDKCLDIYEEAMSLLEKNSARDSEVAGLLDNFIGEYYQLSGQYEIALIHFKRSSSILNQLQEIPATSWIPVAQSGNTYRYLGRHDEAIMSLHDAISVANNDQYSYCMLHCVILLGLCYLGLEDTQMSMQYFNKSLMQLKKIALPISSTVSWMLQGIGRLMELQGRETEALEIYMILLEWQFGYAIVQRDIRDYISKMAVSPSQIDSAREFAHLWVTNEPTKQTPFGLKRNLVDYLINKLDSLSPHLA